MSAFSQKAPNLRCFLKRRLRNTAGRHCLADGQLSSLYAPLSSFSSFGAASVMMCCSVRSASSSAPSVLPEDRIGRKYNIISSILWTYKCSSYVRPDLYRFEARLEPSSTTARMPASLLVFPCLSLIPDATAKLIASSHHFTPPRQVLARLAPLV